MCLLIKFIELNWQFITGISTTVIALCALAFSIWQGIQTRKHNKLSVRPHFTIWTKSDVLKGFFAIELTNNGIGPALIEKFLVTIDSKVISGQGTEPIEKGFRMIFPDLQYTFRYGSFSKGYSIAAKDKFTIANIQFSEPYPSPEFLKLAYTRLNFQITYKSFYEEHFIFNSLHEEVKFYET